MSEQQESNKQSKAFSMECKGVDKAGKETLEDAIKVMIGFHVDNEHNQMESIIHCNYYDAGDCLAKYNDMVDNPRCPYKTVIVGPQKDAVEQSVQEQDTVKLTLQQLPNTVVKIPSKHEFDVLLSYYEAAGWYWVTGDKPSQGKPIIRNYDDFYVSAFDGRPNQIGTRFGFLTGKEVEHENYEVISLGVFFRKQNIRDTVANGIKLQYPRKAPPGEEWGEDYI